MNHSPVSLASFSSNAEAFTTNDVDDTACATSVNLGNAESPRPENQDGSSLDAYAFQPSLAECPPPSSPPFFGAPVDSQFDVASRHLRLRHGTLDDAAIGTLLCLPNVASIEIAGVHIPPQYDLAFARLLDALKVERIDYTSDFGPDVETSNAIKRLDAALYLKINASCDERSLKTCMPQLRRLDIADTDLTTADVSLLHALRLRASALKELVCTPARGHLSGRALAHLPVERLTLVKGTFGKTAAHALQLNLNIVSLTLQSVPVRQEWISALLRMSALKTLTITAPRATWIPSATEVGKTVLGPVVDQEWAENILKPAAEKVGIDVIFNA